MKRKIFISINIPEKTKKRLVQAVAYWQNFPVKWVKEANLHITLSFLGFVGDEMIAEICEKTRQAVQKSEMFDLVFERIELGPNGNDPRMFWLIGAASEELRVLQENIEKALGTFIASKKSFRPHITLGKIRAHKWKTLEKKPEIFLKLSVSVPVESVEVMASDFSETGPEYTIIESCPLK